MNMKIILKDVSEPMNDVSERVFKLVIIILFHKRFQKEKLKKERNKRNEF